MGFSKRNQMRVAKPMEAAKRIATIARLPGMPKAIKRLIHIAAKDGEDKDVGDVEAVADFPDEQKRTECKGTAVESGTRGSLAEQGREQHSAKADRQQSVRKCGAVVEHERDARGTDGESPEGDPLPCSRRPVEHSQGNGNQGPDGEPVQMGERVGGGKAISVKEAHQRRDGHHGGGDQNQPAGRDAAGDRCPEKVELLLDGEAPGRADGTGKGDGPEVLDKEQRKSQGAAAMSWNIQR